MKGSPEIGFGREQMRLQLCAIVLTSQFTLIPCQMVNPNQITVLCPIVIELLDHSCEIMHLGVLVPQCWGTCLDVAKDIQLDRIRWNANVQRTCCSLL